MATNGYMEALSPTMEEGRVVKWHKKEGSPVTTGDTLAEVETDKAVMDLVARADGVLRQVAVAEGETVAVGKVVAVIAAPGETAPAGRGTGEEGRVAPSPAATAPAPPLSRPSSPAAAPAEATRVKASPLARRIAKETGVDLKLLTGSGPGGRVVRRDLEEAGRTGKGGVCPAAGQTAPAPVVPLPPPLSPLVGGRWGADRDVPLCQIL